MQIEKVKVDTIVHVEAKTGGLQRAKVVGKTDKTVKIQVMIGSRYETDKDGNRITKRVKADKIKEIRKHKTATSKVEDTQNETELA